jgi:hypothetical protein
VAISDHSACDAICGWIVLKVACDRSTQSDP